MKSLLTIVAVIAVVVALIRAILNAKDEETEKAFNDVRDVAYDEAWKIFAPNLNKKIDTPPFKIRRSVNPPVLAVFTENVWYDIDDSWENCYDIYKFVNGKWEFCCKKALRRALWDNVGDYEICKKLNCSRCANYFYLNKNIRKSKNLTKTWHYVREEYL